MSGLLDDEDKPYFSVPYLIETFLGFSRQDIVANAEAKERLEKKKKESESKEDKEGKGGKEGEGNESITL
jgi:hypothetical protein